MIFVTVRTYEAFISWFRDLILGSDFTETVHANLLGTFFVFCWPCILVYSLSITNLTHNSFFMYVYFYSLHVSGSHVPIIRRINCINTTSGICHSVSMTDWCAGLDETVSSKPAHQTVIYTEWHIPDIVLIQLILLMMGTWLPETCRE